MCTFYLSKVKRCLGTVVLESRGFFVKKYKNRFFEEQRVFSDVLIKFKCSWYQTGPDDFNKHQALEIMRRVIFLNITFFEIF